MTRRYTDAQIRAISTCCQGVQMARTRKSLMLEATARFGADAVKAAEHKMRIESKERGGRSYQRAVCSCEWTSTWQPIPTNTRKLSAMADNAAADHMRKVRADKVPEAAIPLLPELPEAAIPLLGEVSDREAATRTGTTARVVAAHRKARRIPPVRSGPKPVAGATRDQRHSYWVSPEESAAIHLAIEVARRKLSDVARELMLAWARSTPGGVSPG